MGSDEGSSDVRRDVAVLVGFREEGAIGHGLCYDFDVLLGYFLEACFEDGDCGGEGLWGDGCY